MNNKILEEIKERYTNPPVVEVIDGISYALIDLKNLEWLIEQAQRSLYLEEREKEIIDINQHETQYRQELESINMELNQQNKRYREALEFYADEENYITFYRIFLSSYQNNVDEDNRKKARKVLEVNK